MRQQLHVRFRNKESRLQGSERSGAKATRRGYEIVSRTLISREERREAKRSGARRLKGEESQKGERRRTSVCCWLVLRERKGNWLDIRLNYSERPFLVQELLTQHSWPHTTFLLSLPRKKTMRIRGMSKSSHEGKELGFYRSSSDQVNKGGLTRCSIIL